MKIAIHYLQDKGASASLYTGYYYLVDEYIRSVNTLMASVEDLKMTQRQIKLYVEKMDALEAELLGFKNIFATSDDIDKARFEVLRSHDDSVSDHLKLKSQVWDLEKAVNEVQARMDALNKENK